MNSCPGTKSENAGYSKGCEGCPNVTYCQQPKEIDPDLECISQNIKNVKNIISIMSGKGGVGKSTFTVNFSNALSFHQKVLLLDFDLSGPSIPRLTGTVENVVFEANGKIYPIQINENLYVLSVGHFLKDDFVYSSKTKNQIMKKILKETCFLGYDTIVFDTPPGITDEHLGLVNYLNLKFAILVTSPQMIAFSDVIRQIDFCRKSKIDILGVVENMRDFICPSCNHSNKIFIGDHVNEFCEKNGIEYLGSIGLDPEIAKACDKGQLCTDSNISIISKKCLKNLEKIIL